MHTSYVSSYPDSVKPSEGRKKAILLPPLAEIEYHGVEKVVGCRCDRMVNDADWSTEAHCNQNFNHML